MGAYKVGDWPKAIDMWSMARGSAKHLIEKDLLKDDQEALAKAKDLEFNMWLNLAQAHIKNEEFYQALDFAG